MKEKVITFNDEEIRIARINAGIIFQFQDDSEWLFAESLVSILDPDFITILNNVENELEITPDEDIL